MAEPYSIATDALQSASKGLALIKVLHEVTHDFCNAESDVKAIVREIDLTSKVLSSLGSILGNTEILRLCSPTLHTDAQAALHKCREAFDELETALKSMQRSTGDGTNGLREQSHQLTWPPNQTRIDGSRAHVDNFRTLFSLMFNLVSAAAKQRARSVPNVGFDSRKCVLTPCEGPPGKQTQQFTSSDIDSTDCFDPTMTCVPAY